MTQEPVIESVFRKLGGRQALGEEVSSEADLARLVHRGIGTNVLRYILRAGFSKQEVEHLIIPARTWTHRKAKKQPLSLRNLIVSSDSRAFKLWQMMCLATLEKPTSGFAKN